MLSSKRVEARQTAGVPWTVNWQQDTIVQHAFQVSVKTYGQAELMTNDLVTVLSSKSAWPNGAPDLNAAALLGA